MQKTEKKKLAPIKSYMLFPNAHFSGSISTWIQCTVTTKMVQSFWKFDLSMNFWHIWIPFFLVARPGSQKASFSIFEFFWRFGRQVWECPSVLESEPKTASPVQQAFPPQKSRFLKNFLRTSLHIMRAITNEMTDYLLFTWNSGIWDFLKFRAAACDRSINEEF